MAIPISKVAAAITLWLTLATFVSGQKVVEFSLNRASKVGESEIKLDTHDTPSGFLFSIDLKVGTPPQNVRVQIDTGSSDLIIPEMNSPLCKDPNNLCNPAKPDGYPYFPGFSSNASKSYQLGPVALLARFGDAGLYKGAYANETIRVGNASLSNFTFGLAVDGKGNNPMLGILGLSYPSNEAGARNGLFPEYPNFPQQLKNQGLIDTVAFSVYLNGEGEQRYPDLWKPRTGLLISTGTKQGSLLFGGIDKAKFEGSLSTLPYVQVPGTDPKIKEFTSSWTSMTVVTSKGNDTVPLNRGAMFDTGAADILLEEDVIERIRTGIGWDEDKPGCSYAEEDASVVFGFNNDPSAVITLKMSDVLKPNAQNETICNFVFSTPPTPQPHAVFGDPFLRHAYTVFDLENSAIHIAQAKVNVTESDIVEFKGKEDPDSHPATATITPTNIVNATLTGALPTLSPTTGAAAPMAQVSAMTAILMVWVVLIALDDEASMMPLMTPSF